MAKSTVTVLAEAAESVTSKTAGVVPLLPSVTVALAIESNGEVPGPEPSSFVIVPRPVPFSISAPVGFERMTRKVSFVSTAVSPMTNTVTVFAVWPGLKMSVPVAGW